MHCALAGQRRRATLAYVQIMPDMTSPMKPEVHNLSLRRRKRTEPRPYVGSMDKTFGEDRTCSSENMIAGRQTHTHRHTYRQTDRQTRSSQYSALLSGATVLAHVSRMFGSVAEWLAFWTQAQKGLGSNRSRDAVG